MRQIPLKLRPLIWPHLKDFGRNCGELALYPYYRRFFDSGTVPSAKFRRALIDECVRIYPEISTAQLEAQLKLPAYYCIAGHGGFENPCSLVGGSLLTTAVGAALKRCAFFFTCAAVTPKHPACPAGFALASRIDGGLGPRYALRFLSDKYRAAFISRCPYPERASLTARFQRAIEQGALLPHEKKSALEIAAALLKAGEDFKAGRQQWSFADTILRFNRSLYQKALSALEAQPIFIDIDQLTVKLMAADLKDPESDFYQLLTNLPLFEKLICAMSGTVQAWELHQAGPADQVKFSTHLTVLFYHLLPKFDYERLSCIIEPGRPPRLTGPSGWTLELTPQALSQALLSGELHPNTFAVNFFLTYCHQLCLSGGIFFYHYIRRMLSLPAFILGTDIPYSIRRNLIQSYVSPIRAVNPDPAVQGTLNAARGLNSLDLYSHAPLSTAEIEKMFKSPVKQCLPLSAATVGLDFDLTRAQIKECLPELWYMKAQQAPLNWEF